MKITLRREWFRNVSLLLAGLLLASCSEKSAPDTSAAVRTDGKILIRGSNTIGEELAPRLIAEFKKDHQTASFDLETKGTSYGMGALMGGYCDIAGASRLPTKEELEVAQFRGVELNDYVIGAYSVAVVVNANSPVSNLTKDQVRDIFTGTITNWSAVGGPDAAIKLYVRDPISGTYLGFKEIAMENKPYTDNHNLFTNYTGIVEAVAKDANGIGYASVELVKAAGVKGVSIGGVAPSIESVNKDTYPYKRTLHLYTNKSKEAPGALEFIKFIQSAAGQKVVADMGLVPNP
ncbi:MAG: PstS family phosphate ABC transporter substrate-binding protein [Verrucomicrobiota bacterium]